MRRKELEERHEISYEENDEDGFERAPRIPG
jgi:hypothetical protein